tara:strand:+ start:16149 stop:16265 length:117 start_codon:yes stop_codon:yes gene_type:complete
MFWRTSPTRSRMLADFRAVGGDKTHHVNIDTTLIRPPA